MGDYSIAPRPVPPHPHSLRRTMAKAATARPEDPEEIKPRWTTDQVFAAAGLGLLLLGLATHASTGWVLWLGLLTAVGFAVYLALPYLQKPAPLSWKEQRRELLDQWSEVTGELSAGAEKRYRKLEQRVSRLSDLFPLQEWGSLLRPGEYLLWLYLKLLLARDHLEESVRDSQEEQVVAQRAALLAELEDDDLTPATRDSKLETVLILDQRVLTIRSRPTRIQEIESDLARVEQWVALMHDQAAQHNIMGDSGRRIHFARETLTLTALDSLPGSHLQSLDSRINAQAGAS